jgi:hypothetical protein
MIGSVPAPSRAATASAGRRHPLAMTPDPTRQRRAGLAGPCGRRYLLARNGAPSTAMTLGPCGVIIMLEARFALARANGESP